jgi:hypothetical protein
MTSTDSLRATEAASAAVAKNPDTRVKLADIEANIARETYLTGADAANNELDAGPIPRDLEVLTLCLITLRNGFTVVGKAAPADPSNFDWKLGRQFAREDAIRQIWPLMGYALREKLAGR